MLAKLVLVGGRANRRELAVRTPSLLGRSDDANIVLRHPMISRRQCELIERDGRLVLRDLGSRNGTLLNDQPTSESTVEPGDRITIGPLVFEVQYKLAVKDTAAPDAVPLAVAPPAATKTTVTETTATKPVATKPAEDVAPVEDVAQFEEIAPPEEEDAADLLDLEMLDLVEDDAVEGDDALEVADDDQAPIERNLSDETDAAEPSADELVVAAPLVDDPVSDELGSNELGDGELGDGEPGFDQVDANELGTEELGSAAMNSEVPNVDEMELVDGGDSLETDVADAELLDFTESEFTASDFTESEFTESELTETDFIETAPGDSEPAAGDQPATESEPPAGDAATIQQSATAPGESDAGEFRRFDAAAAPPEPLGDLGDTICDPLDEDELLANATTPAPEIALEGVDGAVGDVADDELVGELELDDRDDLAPDESVEAVESGSEGIAAFDLDEPAGDEPADDDPAAAEASGEEVPAEEVSAGEASAEVAPVEPLAAEPAAGADEFEDIFAEPAAEVPAAGQAGMVTAERVDPSGVEGESVDSLDELITSSDQMTADGTLEAFGESDSDAQDLNLDDLSSQPDAAPLMSDIPAPEVVAATTTVPPTGADCAEASSTADAAPKKMKKKRGFGLWPFRRKAKAAAAATGVVAATAAADLDSAADLNSAVDAVVLDDVTDAIVTDPIVTDSIADPAAKADETIVLDFGSDAAMSDNDASRDEPAFEEAASEGTPAVDGESGAEFVDAGAGEDALEDTDIEDAAKLDFAAEPELNLDSSAEDDGAGAIDLDETVSADAPLDLDATIDAPAMFEQEVVFEQVVDDPPPPDAPSPPAVVAADELLLEADELVLEDLEPAGDADLAVDATVLSGEVVSAQEVEAPPISAALRGEADTLGSSLFEDGQALEATLAVTGDADAATAGPPVVEPTPALKTGRGSLLGRLLGRGKKKPPSDATADTLAAPATLAAPDTPTVPGIPVAPDTPAAADTPAAPGTPVTVDAPAVTDAAQPSPEPTVSEPPQPGIAAPSASAPDVADDEFMDFLAEGDAVDSPPAVDLDASPPELPETPETSDDTAEKKDDGFDDLFKDL